MLLSTLSIVACEDPARGLGGRTPANPLLPERRGLRPAILRGGARVMWFMLGSQEEQAGG